MRSVLWGGVVRKPKVTFSGDLECDEVYVVAGHKCHPEAVSKRGSQAGAGG